jgi:transposase
MEIARRARVSTGFVRQVIQQYNREGEATISTPGKCGRQNCYLSWSQEQ